MQIFTFKSENFRFIQCETGRGVEVQHPYFKSTSKVLWSIPKYSTSRYSTSTLLVFYLYFIRILKYRSHALYPLKSENTWLNLINLMTTFLQSMRLSMFNVQDGILLIFVKMKYVIKKKNSFFLRKDFTNQMLDSIWVCFSKAIYGYFYGILNKVML